MQAQLDLLLVAMIVGPEREQEDRLRRDAPPPFRQAFDPQGVGVDDGVLVAHDGGH